MEGRWNVLLTSAGRRSYLVEYFREALRGRGLVCGANSQMSPALAAADRSVVTPLIYDEAYIPFLLDYCRKNQIAMLVPLFDVDLPVLAARREDFARIGVQAVVSDPEAVRICNDKWETYRFLRSHQLLAPKTFLHPEEAKAAVRRGEFSYPLMVKPRWGMGSLAVFEAENEAELALFWEKSRREIERSYLCYEAAQDQEACVVIQEKLQGQEYGLDVINDLDCRYRTTIIKKKEAMRSGETDQAVTEENRELEALGRTVSGLLGHRGNLDMDVFEAEGRYYILEMNARFGGGYPFSHAAGANLPEALINWAMGEPERPEWLKARSGVRAYKDLKIAVLPEGR